MSTETVSKPVVDNGNEDSDVEKPLVFNKKSSIASNSNQSKSNPQRSKAVASTLRSPVMDNGNEDSDDEIPLVFRKSSVASNLNQSKSNPQRSKAVASTLRSPVMDNRNEDSDDEKPLVFRKSSVASNSNQSKSIPQRSKAVASTFRSPVMDNGNEDSNDEKPLVFKKSSVASNSNQSKSIPQRSKAVASTLRSPVMDNGNEDSDDEKPLVFKKSSVASNMNQSKSIPQRSKAVASTLRSPVMDNGNEDSDDEKPLVFNRKSSVASNSNQSKSMPQRSKAVASTKVSPLRSPVVDNGNEDSDDDKPLVFKRKSSVASYSNQSKSNPHRSKAVASTKVLPLRSPVTSPNGTTSSNITSTMKSSMPSCSSKSSPAKSPLLKDMRSTVEDRSQSQKYQSESKRDPEDSEDDKPLSCIPSGNSSRPKKEPTSSQQPEKKNSGNRPLDRANIIVKDESDDETPISSACRKMGGSGMLDTKQVPSTVKDSSQSQKDQSGSKREREDSEADRPLSCIPSGNSSRPKKEPTSSQQPEKKMSGNRPLDRANIIIKDESDDETPISSACRKMGGSGMLDTKQVPSTVKDSSQSQKDQSGSKREREDSEDDRPLSCIRSGNSSRPKKEPTSSQQVSSPQPEKKNSGNRPLDRANIIIKDESDDETPVSSMCRKMSGSGMSGTKQVSNDEKKPLAKKLHQNGSTLKNEVPDSKVLGKRPLEKNSSADQTSLKKVNVTASPTLVKMKQDSVQKELDDKGRVLVSPKPLKAKKSTREDGTDDDDDDDVPISKRFKSDSSNSKISSAKPKAVKLNSAAKSKVTRVDSSRSRTMTKNSKNVAKDSKYSTSSKSLPSSGDGQKKWTTLMHNGVIFPPPYKPHGIKILYKGKPVDLTTEQEEVATMFAVMRETDYYNKPQFRENFWNDWRALLGKKHVIQNLDDCDFTPIYEWHLEEKEKKKQMSTEEKKAVKEEKLKLEEKYMWAVVDGVKEKVGNFRVEPPGLFRGRGEHPKMGKLKKRIRPCEITLNIGKDAPIPECPITGERWKEVKHDNTVTWLAFWNDPINPRECKYVFLAASSALKGLSDKEKYEKARNLTDHIDNIRTTYTKNFTATDVTKRQIAVATYLIDKLALRAGNEKDDDEADTVGCCTLKVGNVECIPPNKIKFDFLGKDSIQYVNTVEVEPLVYKAIGQFQAGKSKTDDLFDMLDTSKLNAHLKELVPGLTAKVFRTYNASITLDAMLSQETKDGDVAQKVVVYQKANKEVAIICNHQRTISKSHGAQIEKLTARIEELREGLKELKTNLDRAKKGKPPLEGSDGKKIRNLEPNAWEKKIAQQNAKIEKMERDMHTKEDLKTVALSTSKVNYLDPRITVAWCKRHEVPIEKIFTKALLEKFAWAMDVEPDFRFSRQM